MREWVQASEGRRWSSAARAFHQQLGTPASLQTGVAGARKPMGARASKGSSTGWSLLPRAGRCVATGRTRAPASLAPTCARAGPRLRCRRGEDPRARKRAARASPSSGSPEPPTRRVARARARARSARAPAIDSSATRRPGRAERAPRPERPAALSERETEVVGLLGRGFQTKQVAPRARELGQDRRPPHPECLRQIGVSTRAAAALFAVEHGLIAWGELPIAAPAVRS